MSSLISNFDAESVPQGTAIPEKTQIVCLVTEMEDKESTSTPGNWMIAATIEVVDNASEFKGSKIFTNFNVRNSNPTAERIGKSQLAQLCLAVGCPQPKSNNDLLNKPFRATFGKPQDFNGELQSRIQKFDPVGGSAGVTSNLGGGNGAGGGGAAKPSWAKNAG